MARIALISDIHGNLEAFQAVLADVASRSPDHIVCLGDVVGYGPDPAACVALAHETCDAVALGNHDEAAVVGRELVGNFNDAAARSLAYTTESLGSTERLIISGWIRRGACAGVAFSHGGFGAKRYTYLTCANSAATSLAGMDGRIGAVGHTHVPSAFSSPLDGAPSAQGARCVQMPMDVALSLTEGLRFIVNPGSVGQPRDRNPDASWGIVDTERGVFQVHRVAYDIDAVEWKIRRAGLPDFLGERLRVGA